MTAIIDEAEKNIERIVDGVNPHHNSDYPHLDGLIERKLGNRK